MSTCRRPVHVFRWRGLSLCVVVALAPCARAADWYVDAVQGSDSNPGTGPGTAWRTVTHAVSTIAALPNDVQTIHVAPGVYNSVLGEVFPLGPAPRTRIVGTQGSALTILEGPASSLLVYAPGATVRVDAQSGAEGLTLRAATTGISVVAGTGNASPAFHDILVESMSGPGVQVTVSSGGPFGGASASATFDRLEVAQCDVGVLVSAQGGGLGSGVAGLDLEDSVIRSSTNDGIHCSAAGNAAVSVALRRCRVVESGGNGVYLSSGGGSGAVTSARLMADACLLAGNSDCGVLGEGSGSTFGGIELSECTVASNTVCGVRGSSTQNATLRNTILAQNGDDLDLVLPPSASFSDCANGDLAGFPNCIAADPRFVDPLARDYRLRFGSPCIDSADPAASNHIDLALHVRPYDGDLDTIARPDMGALEFAPLELVGVPRIGTKVPLEITGPAGAPTTLYFSRQPLLVAPASTPFGALWLSRDPLAVYGPTVAQPGPPNVVPVRLPSDPSWIGRTVSFQARIASIAAPAGAALSNPVSFTLLP